MKKTFFSDFNDILKRLRKQYPSLDIKLDQAWAVEAWSDSVGPQIAKHSKALKVSQKILTVQVDHAAWRNEIHLRKRQILEKLNRDKDPEMHIVDLYLI